jgi:hypothetical protein
MPDYKTVHLYSRGGGQYKVEAWGWTADHGPERVSEGLSAAEVAEIIATLPYPKSTTIHLHENGAELRETPADLKEAFRLRGGGGIDWTSPACTLCHGEGFVGGAPCPDCRKG